MTEIYLINEDYPFEGDDYFFIEPEVKQWSKKNNIKLTLLPCKKTSKLRYLPDNIRYETFLIKKDLIQKKTKFLITLQLLLKLYFWKEVVFILKNRNLKSLKDMYNEAIFIEYYKENLMKRFLKVKSEIIIYNYWFDTISYASLLLKNVMPNIKVITRAHGYDVYEERRAHQYMPFKRQFANKMDKIFAISAQGKKYLEKKYNIKSNLVDIARLGVKDHHFIVSNSPEDELVIVSCSSIIHVKRLDKLINALPLLSKNNSRIKIKWIHIGDGNLKNEIEKLAREKLDNLSNMSYCFMGALENKKVFDFYKNTKIDIFVNVSDSEGVPVSIMEAMSVGIPIIAPNIGGIEEQIIHNKTGYLMSDNFSIYELVKYLGKYSVYKNINMKYENYKLYLEKYNDLNNYTFFIKKIEILGIKNDNNY